MTFELGLVLIKFLCKNTVLDKLPVFVKFFTLRMDLGTCLLFVEFSFFKFVKDLAYFLCLPLAFRLHRFFVPGSNLMIIVLHEQSVLHLRPHGQEDLEFKIVLVDVVFQQGSGELFCDVLFAYFCP